MGYGIGSVLSLAVAAFAKWLGLDRDCAFYPTVLIVVASYYVLFAVMGGTPDALLLECMAMAAFVLAAVAGFKVNLWFAVAGLVGHGIFDFFHAGMITNAGVPHWWPSFCLSFDAGAGAILGWLLWQRRTPPSRP